MGTDVFKIDGNNYIPADYIKSESEVDAETLQMIREKYSESDETKIHRQMLNGEKIEEFREYNDYVNACRAIGSETKTTNAVRLSNTLETDITDESGNVRTIHVMVD